MNSITSMSNDKLRRAVDDEKLAATASPDLYKLLSTKITQYQMDKGPAPTEDEFNQWLADVKYAVDLRKMLAGA